MRILVLLFITVALAAADLWIRTPLPDGAVPLSEFSAERAIQETHNLLPVERPRPTGSPENHAVRDRIVASLRELGFHVVIEAGDACSPIPHVKACAPVENILATPTDASSAPNLLLTAHYDSVPTGPGVADDLVNVGILLEMARALQASPASGLRPVSLLVTDGEEPGLLGAELFRTKVAMPDRYLLDINLEARGSSGPSLMFQSSRNDAALIQGFAHAVRFPHAASWMAARGESGNHTDFDVFRRAGLQGLNFAFVEGFANYHTMGDSFDHLDERSVEDQGSEVFALTQYFRDPRHAVSAEGDAVFLDVLHLGTLHWPAAVTWPMVALLWVVFGYAAWRNLSRREGSGALRAAGAVVLILFGIPVLWALLLMPLRRFARAALHANSLWVLVVLLMAAVLAAIVSVAVLRWRAARPVSRAGALLVVAGVDLLLLTIAGRAPEVTSLFLLQAIAAVGALLVVVWRPERRYVPAAASVATYAVAAVVLVPAFHLFYVLFGAFQASVAAVPCALLLVHAVPVVIGE